MTLKHAAITKTQFEQLAAFRYQLRRFLRFSEEVTRRHGITPLQYQLLLQIRGFPGRDWATVGELAERLQAKHNAVVALVTRCAAAGLVSRQPAPTDAREVHVVLRPAGLGKLEKLAQLHHAELRALRGTLPFPAAAALAP